LQGLPLVASSTKRLQAKTKRGCRYNPGCKGYQNKKILLWIKMLYFAISLYLKKKQRFAHFLGYYPQI
jgi:hypothetical protein